MVTSYMNGKLTSNIFRKRDATVGFYLARFSDVAGDLCTKDNFQSVELIKERDTVGLEMVSLDLTSLFTSEPILRTSEYMC